MFLGCGSQPVCVPGGETKVLAQETAGPRVWVDKDRAEAFWGGSLEERDDFLLRRVRDSRLT